MRLNVDLDAKPVDLRPGTSWIMLCPTGDDLDLLVEQT